MKDRDLENAALQELRAASSRGPEGWQMFDPSAAVRRLQLAYPRRRLTGFMQLFERVKLEKLK